MTTRVIASIYTIPTLFCFIVTFLLLLAHLSRRLKCELIVYQYVSVNILKLEYLRNQWANRNEILSEPSLGWGKGCIRFGASSDRNSGVHGNG